MPENEKIKPRHQIPFLPPRTFPAHWDLQALEAMQDNSQPDLKSPGEEGGTDSKKDPGTGRQAETFPKTRTMPENWDLGDWLDEF